MVILFQSSSLSKVITLLLLVHSFTLNVGYPTGERYVINTKGCRIPDLDAFDPNIMDYFRYEEKEAKCNMGHPALIDSNATAIFLVRKSLRFYGILEEELLRCRYTPFYRVEPAASSRDNRWRHGKSVYFFDSAAIGDKEFVMVECFYNAAHVYKDFFPFVPLKNVTINDDGSFNVLLIGLDGISRLNFYRQMKRTRSVLEKTGAIELFGYNKVGDNSFPNLLAIFSGLSEEEMVKVCWPDADHYFDDCPFVWKAFKEKGYTTAFGEDSAWLGTFHYTTKKGFFNQATDYFWSYFDQIAEFQAGNRANRNVWDCIGARQIYKVFLDYVKRFVGTMREHNAKYFGYFFETIMSHDNMTKPKLADGAVADFLQDFLIKTIAEDTVLVFFSDHGMRWGGFRNTYQGTIEDRLPFIYIYLPESFKERYPDAYGNVLINRRRLTTPYDLHETLLDLTDPDTRINSGLAQRKRFYSLFDPVPEDRTCEDASIPPHFCTCYNSTEVSTDDAIIKEVALFIVDYINGLLNDTVCKKLWLGAILTARVQNVMDSGDENHFVNYLVVVRTSPGRGQFEATVGVTETGDGGRAKSVMGTISRINSYGNQSACVDDFHLRLYCYCP